MEPAAITYLVFGIVLITAIIIDLGFASRRSTIVSMRRALAETGSWVLLALLFGGFLWYETGHQPALEYLSAYLMEWSLSIDNIFVFILIFSFLGVKENYYARVLLVGILLAVLLRIAFISVGVELVARFHWVLYLFGLILLYTAANMLFIRSDQQDFSKNRIYRWLNRFLPLTTEETGGRFIVTRNGKKYYTTLFVVVVLLATTDVLFAVDSIPAVFGITQNRLVIYTSNVFAVLGLRSLFFLLKGAINRFIYLHQGIAAILLFIGLKMLAELLHWQISVLVSLTVILVCIGLSILFSLLRSKKAS